MQRFLKVVGIAAFIGLLGAGCGQATTPQTASPTPSAQTTTTGQATSAVSVTQPVAYVQMDATSQASVQRGAVTVDAQNDAVLLPGDVIMVTTGTLTLIYPNTGASRVDAGSKVQIVAESRDTGIFMRLELFTGSVWTRLERLLGPDEQLSVAANGVVATVRGTAFGVIAQNGGADVQVAEHTVQVALEGHEDDLTHAVNVSVGQGLSVTASTLEAQNAKMLQQAVHGLSSSDIMRTGYRFAQTQLNAALLKAPLKPIYLAPIDTKDIQQLIDKLHAIEATAAHLSAVDLQATFVEPTAPPTTTDLAPGRP